MRNNKKKYLGIVLIIVGILLGVCGGYLVSNLKSDDKSGEKVEDKKDVEDKKEENAIDQIASKLFEKYHSIRYVTKEVIVFNQLKESDFIEVKCDFFSDSMVNDKNEIVGFSWCGPFTEDIKQAFNENDGKKYIELVKANNTYAVKKETLNRIANELFTLPELRDSFILIPEFDRKNWWLEKFDAAFVFVDAIEGKDYYAITFGSEGDPTDSHTYEMINYEEDGNKLNIEYKIIPDYVGASEEIRVLVFEKDEKGNYKFVNDIEK